MDVVGSGDAEVDGLVVGMELGGEEVLDKPGGEGLLGSKEVPALHVHQPGGQVDVDGDIVNEGGWNSVRV